MKTTELREAAKKYFDEELSGEPLCQDLVVDWLTDFAEQQIDIYKIDKIIEFYSTFRTQFEVLPRLTIIYGEGYHKGFAIEWLWFGVYVNVC